MRFFIADAFTDTIFGGNPAGVVLLPSEQDFPAEEVMIKTAAELRYSETAFIKPLGDGAFHLRYFTPAAEVELCGHATIASFAALRAAGLLPEEVTVSIRTLSGDLTVQVSQGSVMMDMAAPSFIKRLADSKELKRLYEVMGLPFDALPLLPEIISTGLPDILLPVKDKQTLTAISPDFPGLAALSEEYEVVGVHAFTLDVPNPEITACCRNFAPLYDIDEEAATGTANGGLTYYLYRHGLAADQCCFLQGETMNRPSKVYSHLREGEKGPQIKIGGRGVVLAAGEIYL